MPPLTLTQYLSTPFEVEPDYVDGHLEPRNVGEFPHAALKGLLAHTLCAFEDQTHTEGVLGINLLVRPNCVRVCDVALLRGESSTKHPISAPPLLCAEIMASEDDLDHIQQVLRDYVTMGVPHVWLLDPFQRRAWTFDSNGLHAAGQNIAAHGTPITIDTQLLFNEINS